MNKSVSPFALPSNWRWAHMGQVARVTTGTADSQDSESGGEYPFYVRSPEVLRLGTYTHDTEAVLTAGDGNVGKIFHHARGRFAVHQRVYVVEPGHQLVARYLYYVMGALFSDSLRGETAKSTVESLRRPMLTAFDMPLPPLADQQQIADYLDHETADIDAFVAEQLRVVDLLTERSDAVLRQEFAGRSREAFAAPIGRLLRKMERPAAPGAGIVTAFRDGEVVGRWARRAEGFTEATSHLGYQGVAAGDLVFHGLDGFAGAVGVSRDTGMCSPVYHVCQANADVDLDYLALLLRSLGRSGFLEAYAWSVRQRAVDYRNWQTFGHLRVSLPDLRDQAEAVRSYRAHELSVELAMADAHAAITLAKERRAALITAAVTGRIDVAAKRKPALDSIQTAIEEAR